MELEGLHCFQPCGELQGSQEAQAEQMEQLCLEQLQCQLSAFPREPLDSSPFGIMCGGKAQNQNANRISFRWQCLVYLRNATPRTADRSVLKGPVQIAIWFPKNPPPSSQFFRSKSKLAKMASNIWLRLWQISPWNEGGGGETITLGARLALPLVKAKALLLHRPQATLSALGGVLTWSDRG